MQQPLSFSLMCSLDYLKNTRCKINCSTRIDTFECETIFWVSLYWRRRVQCKYMRLQPIFSSRRAVSSRAFTMTPICMRRSVREPVGLKISFVCLSFVRARVQRESPRQTRRSGGDGLLVSRLFSPLRQFRQPAAYWRWAPFFCTINDAAINGCLSRPLI